ncbi:UPF0481 protein At3g47200-like isoform X3 [Malus sylvestris]|uniref:UPF0481 protein At3g47200-like n=1 Tax=Malus domestica TaxID=3750 RepID=UPI0010AB34D7|nr:UPF0481 protein At3g47200-like [Malus domestica]XP_050126019.1 UPF0481 protein At3g47200-like isoform X3 [Malus sylvestris]XP_050126020.1 UPF0481 protein At3g47200-like isoform X3 [Malus sylvestris]
MEGINEAPNDIDNPYDPLLEELRNLLPLSPLRCIYRVPERLRQGNEKAYTPQVVSIGPLHHGKEHLKAMEEHKKRYLRHFLSRTGVSFFDYIQMIKEQEGRLRGFYAESIEFSSDQFVRIVLVDAAFVIEFLLRNYSVNFRGEDDYIFNKPMMKRDVRPDLRLLENQLPFFILQVLFNTTFSSANQRPSLLEISYFFIKSAIDSKGKEDSFDKIRSSGVEVQHFVDLIRTLYLPMKSKAIKKFKTTAAPNITELLQAGVKFAAGTGHSLFDIKFSGGILEIPKITINDTTNMTLRNLLAFEQCHTKEANYLTNYVFLMKRLAKTPKDVELLVEYGIIENWLGDTKKISTLLHDLGTRVIVSNHYYAALCEDLNNYCRTPRHKWMANLRQNYFNSPWSIISVVAAVILLILTFIQTVCSIKSTA